MSALTAAASTLDTAIAALSTAVTNYLNAVEAARVALPPRNIGPMSQALYDAPPRFTDPRPAVRAITSSYPILSATLNLVPIQGTPSLATIHTAD